MFAIVFILSSLLKKKEIVVWFFPCYLVPSLLFLLFLYKFSGVAFSLDRAVVLIALLCLCAFAFWFLIALPYSKTPFYLYPIHTYCTLLPFSSVFSLCFYHGEHGKGVFTFIYLFFYNYRSNWGGKLAVGETYRGAQLGMVIYCFLISFFLLSLGVT